MSVNPMKNALLAMMMFCSISVFAEATHGKLSPTAKDSHGEILQLTWNQADAYCAEQGSRLPSLLEFQRSLDDPASLNDPELMHYQFWTSTGIEIDPGEVQSIPTVYKTTTNSFTPGGDLISNVVIVTISGPIPEQVKKAFKPVLAFDYNYPEENKIIGSYNRTRAYEWMATRCIRE
jgi:hypothetical protein